MCGIVGFYSVDKRFSEGDLLNMTDTLVHRGPDAVGHFTEDAIGLGHRRLSIIDLSKEANQPMTSSNERFVICYNGEVYNFCELAKELDVTLKTTSDTEVILELFAKEGPSFVKKLNGMFAISIYDKQTKELYIFRDRLGIKPLYYFKSGNNIAFASELKALTASEYVRANISLCHQAIFDFLHLGYIPEPLSIYNNIYKFPAGSYAMITSDSLNISSYWTPEEQIESKAITNKKEAKEALNNLLQQSVKYRLISDVPFGTFLSGGIDSSLTTAIAQSISDKPIKTFSIGFKEAKFNEASYAKKVSEHLKTDHHEFIVSEKDAIELIEGFLKSYDEPFADSSAIPTMLVSKMARKHVKMTLSGDGGDELFLGYGNYFWAERLSNPLIRLFRKPIGALLSSMTNRYKRAAHLFNYPNRESLNSHIASQEAYLFSEKELKKNLHNDVIKKTSVNSYKPEARKLSNPENQSLFDLRYYLKDDLLVKVDRASMKYSLETRVPILDHSIVKFAYNLHKDLKKSGTTLKYLLKEVLYNYVPKELFDRKKQGFAIPLNKWLKNELSYLIDNYLSEEIITKHNVLSYSYVRLLVKDYRAGKEYKYNRIWALIVLHKWLEEHNKAIK